MKPGPPRLPFRNSDLAGMALIALGLVVAGGWLLGRPMTVTVGLDRVGMTFNAALSFILAGAALSFGRRRVRLTLALLLAVPSLLTLGEHIFKIDLFIDQLFGKSWVLQAAPHPGRMALQAAAAFALTAIALSQLTRRSAGHLRWVPMAIATLVFMIALVSFFGRVLRLDIIYDWHHAARIAPHTAAGLFVLALGLAQLSLRRSFNRRDDVSNDSRRILAVSTAVMLSITIACAAMCFAVVVRHSHDLQQATLERELHNQADLIGSEIANQRHEGERLVATQSQAQLTARRLSSNDTKALSEALHEWSDRRLHLSRGLLAVEVVDATGQRLLQSGSFGPSPSAVVALDAHTRIEIGNDARLAIERPVPADASRHGGVTRMQFALPRLTAALLADASNAAYDTAICHALSQHSMQCLKLSLSPMANLPVVREITGRRGALDLAFGGKRGVTLGAEPDGARFLAAYGPIGPTPLVMSLTTRLDTLYADLRQRLNALLSLMLGLVAGATCILWWQIAPLIAKVVTARSRANDQATRLAMLFDSVEDAIVVFNVGGTIESWNRGAQHLFGYAAEDIIGKDARLLLPEPHASKLSSYIQSGARVQLTGRIEMEARHGGGRLVPIEVSLREMVTNRQRLYVAVMHDISVRREVDRMKSEFVSTISHELRTPLTSIAGSLTLISGGAAGEMPPKVARLVGIARQNSERLIRLINDILDLEKADAGKLDFQLSVRSLRAEVAAVAEFNRGFAQGLGVAIELADGDDAEVSIDSDRLTQVLTNLLSNAAKFSPPGGIVGIRIEREAAGVRVTVSDTGPGIPLEFQPRIFQKFAQADASDSRVKGGTGLGLSIAKTITEQLGGRIGFNSVPGQGTSFHIVLPIHSQASGDSQSKRDEPTIEVERTHDASERGETVPQVLHVEDDQSLTDIVREAMSHNAVVTSARSIAAARHQLAGKHFDAVILDVAMPDGLGVDLLPIAARDGQRRPVVVSYTADEPSRALRASVDVALVKSRHSVNQLMVTVLSHVGDDDSTSAAAARQVSSHP